MIELGYYPNSKEKIEKAEKLQIILVAMPLLILIPEMIEENIAIIFIVMNLLFSFTYFIFALFYKKILTAIHGKYSNFINLFNGIVLIFSSALPFYLAGKKLIPLCYFLLGLFHIFFFNKLKNYFTNKMKLFISRTGIQFNRKFSKKSILLNQIENYDINNEIIVFNLITNKKLKFYVNLNDDQIIEINKILSNREINDETN